MPFYWTHRSIPELASLSKEQRLQIWRRSYIKSYRQWQVWAWTAALAIPYVWLIGFSPLSGWRGLLVACLVGLLDGWLQSLICLQYCVPYVRQQLGMACVQCGYDLTGNTSGLCPECGTPVRLPPMASPP